MRFFFHLFAGLLLIFPGIGLSQDLSFYHYGVDEGLPSSQVHDVIQDDYGNLWFATDHGLSFYDGYEFKNYTTEDGLPDNLIFKFQKSPSGKIWASTFSKKLFSIYGETPVFKPYRYNHLLEPLPDAIVTISYCVFENDAMYMSFLNSTGYFYVNEKGIPAPNILETKIGKFKITMAVANSGHAFYFVDNDKRKLNTGEHWKTICQANDSTAGHDYIKACFFESSGTSVFANKRHIILQSKNGKQVVIPAQHEPISLGKMDNNRFWVGYRFGGIDIFDLHGKRLYTFLDGKSVTGLFVDHEGGYWFSTLSEGVYHAKNTTVFTYNLPDNNWIHSLSKNKEGKLCLGSYNGHVYGVSNKTISEIFVSTVKRPALTWNNAQDNQDFFSSDYYFFKKGNTKPIYFIGFNPLFVLPHKEVLLVGGYKGINIFNPAFPNDRFMIQTGWRVNDVCYHDQLLYLATNCGLYTCTYENKIVGSYTSHILGTPTTTKIIESKNQPVFTDIIPPKTAFTDVESFDDKLLLGTKGLGVLLVKNNTVLHINKKTGLSDNFVTSIVVEDKNTIWVCTNSGLNRIEFANDKVASIKIMSANDGLPSNEITDMEVIGDTAWVGTRNGLCYFPVSMSNEKKPRVNYHLKISALKVNDDFLNMHNTHSFHYNQNRFEFGFSGKSFYESAPLIYRYKLEGLETSWNYTRNRSTVYSSLPPGNYTFILQTKGINNSWVRGEQRYSFIIHPPFWKTWWFFISVWVIVFTFIYLFFKFRILTYNRDITRELLRQILKRIAKKTNYVVFREQGKDIRILTTSICYVKSDGNYIDIHTDTRKYTIRYKIGEFLALVPDPLEYLRINRSYIIRIDKVQEKTKKDVTINGEKIAVGETYLEQLEKIKFKA